MYHGCALAVRVCLGVWECSWETFRPVSQLLPEPLWSLWDPVVEYCALVYEGDVVVASLRPQFRCLGRVAVKGATSGAWQRRQLFLATPTSVESVPHSTLHP